MAKWVLLGGALALVLLLWVGKWRWSTEVEGLGAALEAQAVHVSQPPFHADSLSGLPEPVARYLALVLPEGQAPLQGVRLAQRGVLNLSEGDNEAQWSPFQAAQQVRTAHPGFIWEAVLPLSMGLKVRVVDAYLTGRGHLHASLMGLVTLAEAEPTPMLAEGELLRWLAESPWYPTVLLPGGAVSWEAVDGQSALARLDDGQQRVALLFRFGEDGLVTRVEAQARGRSVGETQVATPWIGVWSDYARHDGLLVPTRGEAQWLIDGKPQPYWRGELSDYRVE